ncbi:MAG: tetratricopeptide repeat protein [Thermoplasmatota archaeon]
MDECPLCGGEIKDGVCRMCGYILGSYDIEESENGHIEGTSDKKNIQISKAIMTLRSALLTDHEVEEIRSAVSSSVEVMDVPLSLNVSKEVSLNEKEKELIRAADGYFKSRVIPGDIVTNILKRSDTSTKIGNAFFYLEEYDKALKYYDSTLTGYPRNEDAMYNKAYTLFTMERFEGSKKLLKKILNIDPENDKARFLLELVGQMI